MSEYSEYQELEALCQSFGHHLMTLADSLKGRLTPGEEDELASLLQLQIDLQTWLDRQALRSDASLVEKSEGARQQLLQGDPDSVAYAQALQYARDLVKTIRQKREQQRRLELTAQQLVRAEKLATIGQVAATVAHELGNILTPLLMYAKLIHTEASRREDGQEIGEFAQQITRIAERASNMLRQLVDAARSESAIEIPVQMPQVIRGALALLSPQFQRQHIRVREEFAENIPLVMGRPDQLEQVFINICLNAIDAMPNGGVFSVAVGVSGSKNEPTTDNGYLVVRLQDTGPGILPEHIGKLFEPFFTTKERGAGSGLGLFVSHLIIDQHGGAIEVESEPGAGTTFIIKLPVAS